MCLESPAIISLNVNIYDTFNINMVHLEGNER